MPQTPKSLKNLEGFLVSLVVGKIKTTLQAAFKENKFSPSRNYLKKIVAFFFFQENRFLASLNISAGHKSVDKEHFIRDFLDISQF